MPFQVLGPIANVELIATGHGIRELRRLNRIHGKARWRKMKGYAIVKLSDGIRRLAEVHWYAGHGKGKTEMKIKRFLDQS